MKRCPQCALPEVFPGIEFHEGDICNYCIYHDLFEDRLQAFKKQLKIEFERVVEEAKQNKNPGENDCIVCFSGGKDSTFLLHFLKMEYGLNPLAYTFDNGFLSPQAHTNITEAISRMDIDHMYLRPRSGMLKRMFREALTDDEMYSKALLPYSNQCCLSCIAMVLCSALKLGRDINIPLVVIGFNPYQAAEVGVESFMKTRSTLFFAHEVNRDDPIDFPKMIRDPLYERVGEEVDRFLIKSQYLEEGEKYPRVLYPFHALVDYDEEEIYKVIEQYGWVKPEDTDICSTNCRMNSVSIVAQIKQRGYHPYIAEMSRLVREGSMTYEEALARENTLPKEEVIRDVLYKLDLTPTSLGFENNDHFLDECVEKG